MSNKIHGWKQESVFGTEQWDIGLMNLENPALTIIEKKNACIEAIMECG